MTRVLVTGGAGFIGSAIVRLLVDRGHEIVVVDDLSSGSANAIPPGVELIEHDISSDATPEVVARVSPDVVVHAAAQISVVRSIADPERDRLVNLIGTARVLEGAGQSNAQRFVFLSSGGAIYGETAGASEAETPRPASYYAVHKLAAEHYVALSGMPYAIARPANVYGPGQRADLEGGVVAIFSKAINQSMPVTIYGDGEQRRDFVHVDDVASAVLAMIDSDRTRGTWNVATATSTSLLELLDLMERVAGRAVDKGFAPARRGEIRQSRLLIERIHDDLGWFPRMAMEDGLRGLLRTEPTSS